MLSSVIVDNKVTPTRHNINLVLKPNFRTNKIVGTLMKTAGIALLIGTASGPPVSFDKIAKSMPTILNQSHLGYNEGTKITIRSIDMEAGKVKEDRHIVPKKRNIGFIKSAPSLPPIVNNYGEEDDIVRAMPTPRLIKKDAIVKATLLGKLPPNRYNENEEWT